jgi:hypothetical protein
MNKLAFYTALGNLQVSCGVILALTPYRLAPGHLIPSPGQICLPTQLLNGS